MKYGRVLTYKDADEARKLIGKRVIRSDSIYAITENPNTMCCSVLESIDCEDDFPFATSGGNFQFIREVIEDESQIMTNRQLAVWCAKGNGAFTHPNSGYVFTDYPYRKAKSDELVPDDIRIRSWDSEEWVLPTVDIYERDCKGG